MQISLDSAPKNTLPIEPPTQRALGNFEPRPPQDPEKKEIVQEAKSSLSSIGELAAGEDSDALANALFGELPDEGSAAAGDVDLVLDTLSDLGTGPGAVEGFQIAVSNVCHVVKLNTPSEGIENHLPLMPRLLRATCMRVFRIGM